MTIDEAIEQFKYDAECNKADLDLSYAEDNEQIAEWLEELKTYKQNTDICPICDTYCSYLAEEFENGYNKAIDDFVEFASTMPTVETEDGTIRPMWLEEIAEQLKEKYNEQRSYGE